MTFEITEQMKIDHINWLNSNGGARLVVPSWSDLSRSNLSGSNLSGSNLSRSDLSGSNLSGSDLIGSNLSRSDLSESNLSESDLSRSDLSRSDLSRSDLSRSDLSGSDLSGVKLWSTIGNNKEIKTIQAGKYVVTYTFDRMQIGCKNYPILEWWGFDADTIDNMDSGALEWWKQWKPILQQIIAVNPAIATGYEPKPE